MGVGLSGRYTDRFAVHNLYSLQQVNARWNYTPADMSPTPPPHITHKTTPHTLYMHVNSHSRHGVCQRSGKVPLCKSICRLLGNISHLRFSLHASNNQNEHVRPLWVDEGLSRCEGSTNKLVCRTQHAEVLVCVCTHTHTHTHTTHTHTQTHTHTHTHTNTHTHTPTHKDPFTLIHHKM